MLAGRTVMITGASSGIGAAAARLFVAEGAAVVLMARRAGRLHELAAELTAAGGAATAVPGDVTVAADAARAVEVAVETYGGLDAAFNNAGWGTARTPMHLMDDADFDGIMDVNVRGVWNCMRQQIPVMLENPHGGSIVNTSSTAGLVAPGVPSAPYIAAKHAVIGLTKAAADEYGSRGIRVNTLAVGATRTELMQKGFDENPGVEEFLTGGSMLPRVAEPVEIAQAAAWLCADRSSFVTGATVPVDGGFTAR
ncbi:2,5-dichloro-2,5-cyclohexadiene-1,4-diol dehydrogenase [Streptomyces mashuensis]|uniref:2,5-dichloro-2,5-cyclohexadiene-1,4-diol dehydrogenase n=2 Tax=Streptomyces mashuensis TaxID=33904 RepID=A0A919B450_9ACTN|nr:2,5-dichloro-2,5-cyclohexadiene-1,4-diol dehydrogenase [Streptomyces mashuensis]